MAALLRHMHGRRKPEEDVEDALRVLDPGAASLETVTSSNADLISAAEKLGLRLPR
jgi:hypothetical protein